MEDVRIEAYESPGGNKKCKIRIKEFKRPEDKED